MATNSILKRGFKAHAERLAKEYRVSMNIHPCAPLPAFKLADRLKIPIFPATDFLNLPEEIKLLSADDGSSCGWSALTMVTESGNRIIVYNPFHSAARQQSDLMHELSHIICDHQRSQSVYDFEIPVGMREFNELQEEEAKCLGSTLQLAKPCLLWASKRKMSNEKIAEYFNASVEMVKYRMNMTGLFKWKPKKDFLIS